MEDKSGMHITYKDIHMYVCMYGVQSIYHINTIIYTKLEAILILQKEQ